MFEALWLAHLHYLLSAMSHTHLLDAIDTTKVEVGGFCQVFMHLYKILPCWHEPFAVTAIRRKVLDEPSKDQDVRSSADDHVWARCLITHHIPSESLPVNVVVVKSVPVFPICAIAAPDMCKESSDIQGISSRRRSSNMITLYRILQW